MTDNQLLKIWKKTHGHCHFCGDPVVFDKRGWRDGDLKGYWEVDHVVQRGKGGEKSTENCLPACTRCNRLRWYRTGEKIRELLLLGLVANDEMKRNTDIGREMKKLRDKRLINNKKRRKITQEK